MKRNLSPQLHQRQTEQMETGVDGEDCGGGEPERPKERDDDWKETARREDLLEELSFCRKFIKNVRPKTLITPFGCYTSLTRHMAQHRGEKPYSCHECDRRFSQKTHLTKHMLRHGEKPFSCSVCDQRFSQVKLLKNDKCVGGQASDLH
uniref:C2H2-type domain-containing protein n=1 Tax=Labrus bergylta TaxID=56723 RepID=A0A3Q3E9B0_9LABR